MQFIYIPIQFEDDDNETKIENLILEHQKISHNSNTDGYVIKSIKEYSLKNPARFGINIALHRNIHTTNGILINYHLMCAMIVMVSAINFLIDPKVVPGRAGLLVTALLVLTNFFASAQVNYSIFSCLDQ